MNKEGINIIPRELVQEIAVDEENEFYEPFDVSKPNSHILCPRCRFEHCGGEILHNC